MSPNANFMAQYIGFGLLFLSGTVAYAVIARKLKDPFKIYIDPEELTAGTTQAKGANKAEVSTQRMGRRG